MTNEQFEQILQRALAPEIDDIDILVQNEESNVVDITTIYQKTDEKERLYYMKTIVKITAIAACTAFIVGAGVFGNTYLSSRPIKEAADSNVESNIVSRVISSTDNSFVLKVGAEEITPSKSVPLIFKNGNGHSLSGSEEDGNVKYCISADFNCEGESIKYVTYSINKGAFAVVEACDQNGSLIKSGKLYEGDQNFPGHWRETLSKYAPEIIDTKYYTEYTLDYDSQHSDRLGINVCGEVFNKEIYNKVFDSAGTPEQKAEGYTELVNGVEITCTVYYDDGTTASETVTVESETMTIKEMGYPIAPDDDPNRKNATFVYKLK